MYIRDDDKNKCAQLWNMSQVWGGGYFFQDKDKYNLDSIKRIGLHSTKKQKLYYYYLGLLRVKNLAREDTRLPFLLKELL